MPELRTCIVHSLLALLAGSPLFAQTKPDFSGLWLLDLDHYDGRDLYGEIRLIHQTQKDLSLTIVDYGSAWIAGEFREVVRIMPWTFRFNRWGPRRGPPDSKQPRTRATWSGETLVLEKSTFSGSGEFVWKWKLDGSRLILQETGGGVSFLRGAAEDPSLATLGQMLPRKGTLVSKPARITLGATPGLEAVLVKCPDQDCTVVYLDNGHRIRSRSLPKEQFVTVPLGAEVSIEPVP